MKITKIKIENFKSIKEIEFDIKKYGSSYTTMLVGINESGKSNILEAMSYLSIPKVKFDYNAIHNQKDEHSNPVDFNFWLEFENKHTYINDIMISVKNGNLIDFEIENIKKRIFLEEGKSSFSSEFKFDIKKFKKGLFIKRSQKILTINGANLTTNIFTISEKNDEEKSFEELTVEVFEKYFSNKIINLIKKYEPSVSLWRPSDKYLVSEVDLNIFKDNIDSNIPLKHIFYISGFNNKESIKSEIEKISNTPLRRKLAGTLGKKATDYIKNIWEHDILLDIEIAESGSCVVSVRDGGKENEFNYHKMTARSEGFKQFMSLILSLSVETKMSKRINNLILIDEPETHLHPSGIRDLRKELLAIGESNYLFVSTHSPFLVDRINKERNVIIKKPAKTASTEKIEIAEHTDIIDDEVLREAFGIEVYKDLLNPNSILVEGASDKKILQKSLRIKGFCYGVTNGHGSNIDTLASKLNDSDISILVILDDDMDGKGYKEKIIKIGGSYSVDNVVTIRDVVGEIVSGGTIEDIMGINFIKSKFIEVYKETFPGSENDLLLNETQPFLEQIRIYLHKQGKNIKIIDKFIEDLKIKVSNDFNPTKTSFINDFPLLNSLVDEIKVKLEK